MIAVYSVYTMSALLRALYIFRLDRCPAPEFISLTMFQICGSRASEPAADLASYGRSFYHSMLQYSVTGRCAHRGISHAFGFDVAC